MCIFYVLVCACAWTAYLHEFLCVCVCMSIQYAHFVTPLDSFIRWSCQDVSSEAARGKNKQKNDWIFLGVVLPCAAFKCLNMPGTSIRHIQSAHKQCKEKGGNNDTAKGMLDRHFQVNSGHSTMWTHHIIRKKDFKNHTKMTSMGLPAARGTLIKIHFDLSLSCKNSSIKPSQTDTSSRLFSVDLCMLQKHPCHHSALRKSKLLPVIIFKAIICKLLLVCSMSNLTRV